MPRPPTWYLQKIDLFADLDDEQMMQLVSGIEHQQCSNRQVIFEPGDDLEHTYILKEGEVTLYQMKDGKRVIIDVLKPGSLFGNIGFDSGIEEGVYAEVTQAAYICTLPQDFFIQMMKQDPKLALRAFKILSKRIAQYQSQLRYLSTLSAKERILATINLLNAKDDQSILPAILRTPTKITHEKLASMTGLTRETVTKQLQTLEQDGLTMTERKNIRLTEAGKQAVQELL